MTALSDPCVAVAWEVEVARLQEHSARLAVEGFNPRPPTPSADAAAAVEQLRRARRKALQMQAVRARRRGERVLLTDDDELVDVDLLLADWEVLRDAGVTFAAAAERMHLSTWHLTRLLDQALADGDRRGARLPFAKDLDPPRPPRKTLRLRRVLEQQESA